MSRTRDSIKSPGHVAQDLIFGDVPVSGSMVSDGGLDSSSLTRH